MYFLLLPMFSVLARQMMNELEVSQAAASRRQIRRKCFERPYVFDTAHKFLLITAQERMTYDNEKRNMVFETKLTSATHGHG